MYGYIKGFLCNQLWDSTWLSKYGPIIGHLKYNWHLNYILSPIWISRDERIELHNNILSQKVLIFKNLFLTFGWQWCFDRNQPWSMPLFEQFREIVFELKEVLI